MAAQVIGVGAPPQTPDAQASSQRYTVSGSVINAATGEPIPRALVQLNANPQRTELSGPDGRFEFQGIPPGVGILTASKPGFFNAQETGLQRTANAYPLIQIGKDSTSELKVNLMPSGSITGHVTDANGEPLEGVQVRAIYHQLADGLYRWEDRASANTDDNGLYRLSGLIPGQYDVATVSRSTHQLASADRPINQNYDDVYPGIYYPGAAELSSATPLLVAAGEPTQADFAIAPQRAYHITGTLNGVPLERSSFTLLDRDGGQVFAEFRSDPATNQFRFSNVVPGDYTIRVNSYGAPDQWMCGLSQVGVSGADVENVAIEAAPTATIAVQVERESAVEQPIAPPMAASAGLLQFSRIQQAPLSVRLVPRDATAMNGDMQSQVAPGQNPNSQVIMNVAPGRYHVEVSQLASGYVAALRSGGTDLMHDDLLVTPGAQPGPIQVVIRASGASIQGLVKKGDSPVAQASILVLPDNPSPTLSIVAASAGAFTVSGLAPGSYHVYAFPSLSGIEYRNPEAMRQYQQQAAAVDLSENDAKQLEVQLITGAQ